MIEFNHIPPHSVNCTLHLMFPMGYQGVRSEGDVAGLSVWNVDQRLPLGHDGVYGLTWERAPKPTSLFGLSGKVNEAAQIRCLS
jgi:hypothetical protein